MQKDVCIHFTGIQNSCCKLGIEYLKIARDHTRDEIEWHNKNYPTFRLDDSGIGIRIPCILGNDVKTCKEFLLPTKQELTDYEIKMDEYIKQFIQNVNIVRPLIIEKVGSREKQYVRDSINCPICKRGIIHFYYHGHVNRHVQAKCNNDKCNVEWIE